MLGRNGRRGRYNQNWRREQRDGAAYEPQQQQAQAQRGRPHGQQYQQQRNRTH